MSIAEIERDFPNLRRSDYKVTSPEDTSYNCIAWAAHEVDRWWWPSPFAYWPHQVPQEETVTSFIQAYATQGYSPCKDAGLESGFEKIAIYVNPMGIPTHAARQLPNGKWTSKLGTLEDIEHLATRGLEGPTYGSVGVVLKRPL